VTGQRAASAIVTGPLGTVDAAGAGVADGGAGDAGRLGVDGAAEQAASSAAVAVAATRLDTIDTPTPTPDRQAAFPVALPALDTVGGVREVSGRSRRQWGVIALAVCDTILVTCALVWYWNQKPVNQGIHGTVVVQRCAATTGEQAYCYGPFASDDGSLSIREVEVLTDPHREVAEGWVDSSDDHTASPTVRAKPRTIDDRVQMVTSFLINVAVHGVVVVALLRRPEPASEAHS
jgi:hypothetical protein